MKSNLLRFTAMLFVLLMFLSAAASCASGVSGGSGGGGGGGNANGGASENPTSEGSSDAVSATDDDHILPTGEETIADAALQGTWEYYETRTERHIFAFDTTTGRGYYQFSDNYGEEVNYFSFQTQDASLRIFFNNGQRLNTPYTVRNGALQITVNDTPWLMDKTGSKVEYPTTESVTTRPTETATPWWSMTAETSYDWPSETATPWWPTTVEPSYTWPTEDPTWWPTETPTTAEPTYTWPTEPPTEWPTETPWWTETPTATPWPTETPSYTWPTITPTETPWWTETPTEPPWPTDTPTETPTETPDVIAYALTPDNLHGLWILTKDDYVLMFGFNSNGRCYTATYNEYDELISCYYYTFTTSAGQINFYSEDGVSPIENIDAEIRYYPQWDTTGLYFANDNSEFLYYYPYYVEPDTVEPTVTPTERLDLTVDNLVGTWTLSDADNIYEEIGFSADGVCYLYHTEDDWGDYSYTEMYYYAYSDEIVFYYRDSGEKIGTFGGYIEYDESWDRYTLYLEGPASTLVYTLYSRDVEFPQTETPTETPTTETPTVLTYPLTADNLCGTWRVFADTVALEFGFNADGECYAVTYEDGELLQCSFYTFTSSDDEIRFRDSEDNVETLTGFIYYDEDSHEYLLYINDWGFAFTYVSYAYVRPEWDDPTPTETPWSDIPEEMTAEWAAWMSEYGSESAKYKDLEILTSSFYSTQYKDPDGTAHDACPWELWGDPKHLQFMITFDCTEFEINFNSREQESPYIWCIWYKDADTDDDFQLCITKPWSLYDWGNGSFIFRVTTYLGLDGTGMQDLHTDDGAPNQYEFLIAIYDSRTGELVCWHDCFPDVTDSYELYLEEALDNGYKLSYFD